MSAPDGDPAVSRPAIRRIGRRRVVSAGPTDPAPHDASAEPRAIRRGSQDQTVDDTDAGWGETGAGVSSSGPNGADDARARWLRAERPPHWG